MPATSQLDWLISMTAMIVLSWSRVTRDLLKSFGWGIAGTPSIRYSDEVAISRRPPHSIYRSPFLDGDGRTVGGFHHDTRRAVPVWRRTVVGLSGDRWFE